MSRIAHLIVAVILATATSAAPAASFQAFQITDTSIENVFGGNVTLQFTIHDPDPLTNATQTCTSTWVSASKGFPTGPYEFCGDSTFGWHMQRFDNIESFILGVEHSFHDPSVGDPPHDWVTTFGKANVTKSFAPCTTEDGVRTCKQRDDTIVEAPIYATIST